MEKTPFDRTKLGQSLSLERGWSQRNLALEFLRTTFRGFKGNAVVYFADDDNAYDLRVFDYIRQVETIGLWAVGK